MRIILFQWLQDSGAVAPAATDILQNQGQPYSPFSSYKKDDAGYTWALLADRLINVNAGSTSVNWSINVAGKKLSKGAAKPRIQFSAAGASGKGHYYLFFVSDSGAVAHPVFTYYSRIRYTG